MNLKNLKSLQIPKFLKADLFDKKKDELVYFNNITEIIYNNKKRIRSKKVHQELNNIEALIFTKKKDSILFLTLMYDPTMYPTLPN